MGPIHPPTLVKDLGGTPVLISVGYHHVCAVLESGAIKCWGEGENGQLGNGCLGSSNANGACLSCRIGCDRTGTPILADWAAPPSPPVDLGGTPVAIVAGGSSYTCAMLDSGDIKCWGKIAHTGKLEPQLIAASSL